LVSIVTPAYNRASLLKETIESVLNQDYPNIEHIVLDDGSADGTRGVLEKYDGRITWESHPNMGETLTVNKGWNMARGAFVAVVNSDDPLLPGAISTAVAFMRLHPEVLVGYPDWNMIGPNSEVLRHVQVHEYDHLHMVRRHDCTVGPGAFIRRKAFELTDMRDPEFRYVADFEYWLRLGLCGPFARIPKTLATFRVHAESASQSHRGRIMAEEHIRLIEKFYAHSNLSLEVLKVRSEALSWAYCAAGIACGPCHKKAREYYLKSLRYQRPTSLTDARLTSLLSEVLPGVLFKALRLGWHTASLFYQKFSTTRNKRHNCI